MSLLNTNIIGTLDCAQSATDGDILQSDNQRTTQSQKKGQVYNQQIGKRRSLTAIL